MHKLVEREAFGHSARIQGGELKNIFLLRFSWRSVFPWCKEFERLKEAKARRGILSFLSSEFIDRGLQLNHQNAESVFFLSFIYPTPLTKCFCDMQINFLCL